jgi:hypothetical protein
MLRNTLQNIFRGSFHQSKRNIYVCVHFLDITIPNKHRIENRITNHQIKQIMSNKINFYIIHQQFKLVVDKNKKNLKYIKN